MPEAWDGPAPFASPTRAAPFDRVALALLGVLNESSCCLEARFDGVTGGAAALVITAGFEVEGARDGLSERALLYKRYFSAASWLQSMNIRVCCKTVKHAAYLLPELL